MMRDISMNDVDGFIGKRVTYIYHYSNWQLPVPEPATVIGRTSKRVRIIHHDRLTGDVVRLVSPEHIKVQP